MDDWLAGGGRQTRWWTELVPVTLLVLVVFFFPSSSSELKRWTLLQQLLPGCLSAFLWVAELKRGLGNKRWPAMEWSESAYGITGSFSSPSRVGNAGSRPEQRARVLDYLHRP